MSSYGSDKPDIRFGMKLNDLSSYCKHKSFEVFNSSEIVVRLLFQTVTHSQEKKLINILIG